MAGCISCVILPLLLFLFHRYIQPIILKFWNPWAPVEDKCAEGRNGFACPLNKTSNTVEQQIQSAEDEHPPDTHRLKND